MTEKRIKTISLCLIVCLMFGCIREDTTGCDLTYTLVVKAYDLYDQELSSGEVSDVSLFVFDSNKVFIERIDARINENIVVRTSPGENTHFVAWGNVGGECHAYSSILPGDSKDIGFVHLLPDPRSEFHFLSPNDLFLGEKNTLNDGQTNEIVLPVYRQVGSLAVTVRHLKTFTRSDEGDYYVVVREGYSVLDFSGKLSGDKVTFRPDGSYVVHSDDDDEFYVPPFHLYPEADGIHIDIYKGSQLIASVSENADGQPITIRTEMLTNVLIDLRTTLSVNISLTPWGEEQVWKEF